MLNFHDKFHLSALLAIGCMLTGCYSSDQNLKISNPSTVQVGVIIATAQAAPYVCNVQGRLSAYQQCQIRPQVDGKILSRHFEEGSFVSANQILFQIDPETYLAAHQNALAGLAKAEAAYKAACLQFERSNNLLATHSISIQDYEDSRMQHELTCAQLQAADALSKLSAISIKRTTIEAPISGFVGKSLLSEGNLVQQSQLLPLAMIQQIDPIYIDFTQSTNDLEQWKNLLQKASTPLKLEELSSLIDLQILFSNEQSYSLPGRLLFTERSVDSSTDSVPIRAVFPNPNHQLLPGMFVRLQMKQKFSHEVIIIPQRALVKDDTTQNFVFLLDESGKVKRQNITLKRATNEGWIVDSGLKLGDMIIVDGLQKIKPGQKAVAVLSQFSINSSL